ADGDRPPHQHPERRSGAGDRSPARGGKVMDPLSIGLLSASIITGRGAAGWAGLKAWNGWLDLKRFELTHDAADRTLPPATGRIELAHLREGGRHLETKAA